MLLHSDKEREMDKAVEYALKELEEYGVGVPKPVIERFRDLVLVARAAKEVVALDMVIYHEQTRNPEDAIEHLRVLRQALKAVEDFI